MAVAAIAGVFEALWPLRVDLRRTDSAAACAVNGSEAERRQLVFGNRGQIQMPIMRADQRGGQRQALFKILHQRFIDFVAARAGGGADRNNPIGGVAVLANAGRHLFQNTVQQPAPAGVYRRDGAAVAAAEQHRQTVRRQYAEQNAGLASVETIGFTARLRRLQHVDDAGAVYLLFSGSVAL